MRLYEIKQPSQQKFEQFVRFGELPENGKSGIGRSPNWIAAMYRTSDEELGISVYETYQKNGKWVIDAPVDSYGTLNELCNDAYEGQRKIYLVSGIRVKHKGNFASGMDGEPLIKTAKILKELTLYDIFVPGSYDMGTEMDDVERAEYEANRNKLQEVNKMFTFSTKPLPTIASATKKNGEIDRNKANRIVDPHGYFKPKPPV